MPECRKQLIKYVVPSILSMVSFFLYTVVDGIFVGQGVGTNALGAINLIFPFIMIFSAVTILVSVGGLTITAIRIGHGDHQGASEVFRVSAVLALIVSVIFSVLATVFVKPMVRLFGANDTFAPLAEEYLFWYGIFIVPCGMCTLLNGFCRNDGDPLLVSVATIIATVLNIFGDWLLIFPLGMGLKGAAIATGVSQALDALICLIHFARKKGVLRFGKVHFSGNIVKKIPLRGMPECVSQFCVPICTMLTNLIIIRQINDVAVNTYSVLCYVASFAAAVFAGTSEGLQPLFGQSYGAGKLKDLKYYFKWGMVISVTGSAIIIALLLAFTKPICALYALDEETTRYTIYTMPLYSWGFLVQSANVLISSYLLSTTRTTHALVINVLRSFVADTLCILVLPLLFGAEPVIWLSFGIYEAAVLGVSVLLVHSADKKLALQVGRE